MCEDLPSGLYSVPVRDISGCRRQLRLFLSFLPILAASVVLGLGALILNFWIAGWKPSPCAGFVAIGFFVIVPVGAAVIWGRRAFGVEKADCELVLQAESLQLIPHDSALAATAVPWERIKRCKVRNLTARHRSVSVRSHPFLGGGDEINGEFVICADESEIRMFADELERLIACYH